jgi:hypothetical protein
MKAMKWHVEDFQYLEQKFPEINDAKTKEGIFSIQTKEVLTISGILMKFRKDLRRLWEAFRLVIDSFLCIYKELAKEMLVIYRIMVYNMSLKTY